MNNKESTREFLNKLKDMTRKISLSNILVVEDNPVDSEKICKRIDPLGKLNIKCVESGEKALLELNEFNPDLIILDINLPGMSGVDFYIECLNNFNIPNDRFVIVSDMSGPDLIMMREYLKRETKNIKPDDSNDEIKVLSKNGISELNKDIDIPSIKCNDDDCKAISGFHDFLKNVKKQTSEKIGKD